MAQHYRAPSDPERVLKPGTPAPDFELPCGSEVGQTISLRSLRGRPVVLAFYPADWSPVCGDQLALYNELLPDFDELGGARVLGISVDGPWCHEAFAAARKYRMPLLSDFEPKGAVSRAYGVYRDDGLSDRALFVIDGDGVIRWSHVSPFYVSPGADGILEALESLAAEHPADHAAGQQAGRR